MRKLAGVLAAAAFIVSAVAGSPSAQTQEFAVGLIRPDGILTPVAVFDGTKWIDSWPEPADPLTLDRMIEAMPSYWRERRQQVPQVWHVARRGGRRPVKVNVLTHVVFGEHCGNQTGLLTDLPSRRDDPHEKAIATDRLMPVLHPTDLTARNASREGWQDLIDVMRAEAARQEAAASLEPATRRLPLRMRRLYAHSGRGIRALYYEVERHKGERPYFVVAGWIVAATGSPPVALETKSGIGFGESYVVSLQPLGLLRIGTTTVWVVQKHFYESEAVSVLEVTPQGVQQVYNKFIGGC